MSTLTIENYVKTIYLICSSQAQKPASTGAIAEALKVSPGSVTSMVRTLAESGIASWTPYEGVQLTDAGTALALRVLRRHRLVELFLVKTLGLSWDEVHHEAENMEHAVSDWLVDRIDDYLGHPKTDPHGDPIPAADGSIASTEGQALSEFPAGSRFHLTRVLDQSSEFLRYLAEAGLPLGVEGVIAERNDTTGVIAIETKDDRLHLSREAAAKLVASVPPT